MKYLIFGLLTILSYSINAEVIDLKNYVENFAKQNKISFVGIEELKGKVQSINLDKENMYSENIIHQVLKDSGYSRSKIGENIFKIIATRDIRYENHPIINVDNSNSPNLDNFKGQDYISMIYVTKPFVATKEISRSLRPFMSRYGRVIDLDGQIIVLENKSQIEMIYSFIKSLDKPMDEKEFQKYKRRQYSTSCNCEKSSNKS